MKAVILSKGKIAVVDDEDFDRVNQFSWWTLKGGKRTKKYYACRSIYDPATQKSPGELMYHFILGSRAKVDHKNGDGTWNTRENIRTCTQTQNCWNANPQARKHKSSKYKGVVWFKPAKLWAARIKVNKKNVSLKYFHDEKEAARAYDKAALIHFGEFARTNQMMFGDL